MKAANPRAASGTKQERNATRTQRNKDAAKKREKYLKKFKGSCTILWPYCFKGRADPKGSGTGAYFVKRFKPLLKGVSIVDSYQKSSEEVAQMVVAAASKKKKTRKKKSGAT